MGELALRVVPTGSRLRHRFVYIAVLAVAIGLPAAGNGYWDVVATRAAIYWILVSGLNLVVGFGGQLAIGYVALLAVGAYAASIVAAPTGVGVPLALIAAGVAGIPCGVVVGLAALRLRSFYFAMVTIGLSQIVTEVALGWNGLTGGGVGLPGPELPGVFGSTVGFYGLCLGLAILCTWLTANIAESHFGRGLMTVRDAEVVAESCGVSRATLFLAVFSFSGFLAGLAGALFAALQSYITPDAFSLNLSILFFIAILVGGRGSILGPLLGTILLTLLPEVAAPLVAWSTFLYAALLLLIVLLVPGGISDLLEWRRGRQLPDNRVIRTSPKVLRELLGERADGQALETDGIHLSFGSVRAIDGLSLKLQAGEIHGLIGPNGSGKTTTLNVVSGFVRPQSGVVRVCDIRLRNNRPQERARCRIARTFQTPRVVGEISVLDNVLVGSTVLCKATFLESLLSLPRQRADEARLRPRALQALQAVGLMALADVRADRLQHSELRFLEIARALVLQPDFLLLDEPAAGLAPQEIRDLGSLLEAVAACGTGVLLVEHHADLIFDVCDRVSVLNLGRTLAAGTPAEVRSNPEVVSAYLGA